MSTKRLPDSLKEASEFQLSNITNDTFIPLFTKSGNTEVMKKIKANVLNNGGGSITAAQPNRVIIIDTTLEQNIEGKAYKTFAEAKTYMENHFGFYQVELPAGEFDESVVLDEKWTVHGNDTTLTYKVKTNVKIEKVLGVVEEAEAELPAVIANKYDFCKDNYLQNCIVKGGFDSEYGFSYADAEKRWSGRSNFGCCVFDNKMWIMGGNEIAFSGAPLYNNDVWYSTDGINWTQATSSASWSVRNGFSCCVFDNKMWIMGGVVKNDDNQWIYYNDVWYSTDGINWTQATSSASWSGRRLFGCCVYNDKMWVIGGQKGNTVRINDVWYSSDGTTWTQATSSADWTVRITEALIYNDKMWIIGGGSGTTYYNDSWFSSNGSDWTEANIAMSIPFYGIKDCEVLNFGNYEGQIPEVPETPYSTMIYLNNFTTYSLLANNCHFEDNNIDAYYDTDNTAYRSSLTFAELMRKPLPFLSAKNCEFIQTSFLNKFRFIWCSTLMSKKNSDYTLNPVTLFVPAEVENPGNTDYTELQSTAPDFTDMANSAIVFEETALTEQDNPTA